MSYQMRADAITQLSSRATPFSTITTQRCPILILPAELRNKIYDLDLVSVTAVELSTTGVPPLLRTCKHIRREVSKIFWSSNSFTLTAESYNLELLSAFFRAVGIDNTKLIRSITIIRDLTEVVKLWEQLQKAFRVDTYPYARWADFARVLSKAGIYSDYIHMDEPMSRSGDVDEVFGSCV